MIQRSLFRSSLSASSSISRRVINAPFRTSSPLVRTSAAPLSTRSIRLASRCYSTETGSKADTAGAAGEASAADATQSTEAKPAEADDKVKKELEAKSKEVVELKDKYLRSVADFRNLQERTKREVAAARDFAIQRFAKDLIDSVDNLDRALSAVPAEKLDASNKELMDLHGGLKMTETILMSTLKKHGLERFDPAEQGEKFDPNKHEATFQTPQPDKEDGTVFYTQQKGYSLNGRVLRAAKVGVVKNS